MYLGNKSKPVAVFIFTYHDDGKLNVTQTVFDKERFGEVRKGLKAAAKWIRNTLKDANKCPYSPKNTDVAIEDDAHETVQTDRDGTLEDVVDEPTQSDTVPK